MLLHDEYLNRHNLKPATFQYRTNSCLFLSDVEPVGRLIRLRWQNKPPPFSELPSHGPGVFVFESKLPQKSVRTELLRTEVQTCLYWDEYEPYLSKWSRAIDPKHVILGEQEAVIFAWQMFVFIHESVFLTCNFRDLLYDSLNTDMSIDDRYKLVNECLYALELNLSNQKYMWDSSFGFYLDHYADWLAKLILNNNKLLLS